MLAIFRQTDTYDLMIAQLIPLTKATGMGPLPDLVEDMAGTKALARVFSKTQLPLAIVENREQEILMPQMVHLFENASREVGERLFGLRVGLEMQPGAYGKWTRYAAEADTLEKAILRLRRTISLHQNAGQIMLGVRGKMAVMTYSHPTMLSERGKNHADHILPVMIRVIQKFMGPFWKPEWVRMFYEDDGCKDQISDAIGADVRFNGKGVSIALKRDDLKTRNPSTPEIKLTAQDVTAEVISAKNRGDLAYIEALVSLRLLDGDSDITGVAQLADTSVRSLQRKLHEEGLSYRKILDRVRFERAKSLLLETSTAVTEISLLTGFSDPAHFTRSFKRWSGVPPSHFRA